MQGVWVQSLVRELRSPMPLHQKPKHNNSSNIITSSIKDTQKFFLKESGLNWPTLPQIRDFPGCSDSKESACNAGDPGWESLSWEHPLEKGMATHSTILAWRIPWTEEPGGLQSMGSQKSQTWLIDPQIISIHAGQHTKIQNQKKQANKKQPNQNKKKGSQNPTTYGLLKTEPKHRDFGEDSKCVQSNWHWKISRFLGKVPHIGHSHSAAWDGWNAIENPLSFWQEEQETGAQSN